MLAWFDSFLMPLGYGHALRESKRSLLSINALFRHHRRFLRIDFPVQDL
jgi:hypothetical protein